MNKMPERVSQPVSNLGRRRARGEDMRQGHEGTRAGVLAQTNEHFA